ncbi:hypothetical protein JCM11491_000636 [Sporobolomyces phaffii]
MSIPRPQSRGPPSSSSRPHSTHSLSSEGPYLPPSSHPSESDFDFCNSFWVTPQRSRRDGRDEDSEERDWGKEGYDTVLARVKSANKVLDDLKSVFKERASIEEDYSKRLSKLSKASFGTGETGHMERAIITLKQELETSSKSHHDLASLLKQQETMVNDFMAKRDGARKTQQAAIEKTWKSMTNQREHVLKAKSKYENDAIQINSLHAQASLLQGRELDKATLKMDKVQQTVVVNERDYKNFVGVLKETTVGWNMAWKTFCDLIQDQEEERLEFVKGRMWDWANAQSTIAMAEDESAERTRTALEQCEPKLDIRIFVQRSATGNCIPDPLPFVDASRTTPHPKQGYKVAKFTRSSTRIPGVKHSPSAVNDIARALHQQTTPSATLPSSASNPSNSARSPAPTGQQQHRGPSSNSTGGAAGASRPPSRSAQHPSNSNLLVESASSQAFAPSTSQETTPTRPPPNDFNSSSRFAPSPNALRQPHAPTGENRSVSPTPGSTRPGHINASAFQNRPGPAPTQPLAPAQYTASPSSSPRKPTSFPTSSATPADEDGDDPLLQALKVLQSTPAPAASPRSSRMSPNPTSGSTTSSTGGGPPARPLSSMGSRPATHRPQSSLGQNIAPPQAGGGSSRSRPTSPAPVAAMMQPQANQHIPSQHSMSVPYGQAFPGERAGQSISRPGSRAGSNVSSHQQQQPNRNSLASPASVPNFQQQRSTSPSPGEGGGFAGVGARGRSPSPQPFIPESLRPRSPAVAQQMQMQAQAQQQHQRPTSAYGNPASAPVPQQQPSPYGGRPVSNYGAPQGYPQAQAPPVQGHPYATVAPPATAHAHPASSPYARAVSPAPGARPASVVGSGGYASHHAYSNAGGPAPTSTSQHFAQPPVQQHPYSNAPPPSLAHQPPPSAYPYPSQTPSHSHHSPYAASPASVHHAQPPPVQYASPAPSSVVSQVQRTPSIHSGISSVGPAQSPYQPQQQPSQHQQQQQQSQQQHGRAASVASVRAGSVFPPPPTGQYTDQGQPIIFYVNALFDYRAASNEEFSFSSGDVIAVTATDPDGWWQGLRVGDQGSSKLFPSK